MTMPQSVRPASAPAPERLSRYAACLLGGAIGDAPGAPVEFMSRHEILRRFGPGGIRDHASAYGRTGAITDDTQMTLFTAEGLLRAAAQGHPPGHAAYIAEVAQAYQRWLRTQDEDPAAHAGADGLIRIAALHSRRAPGTTCLAALSRMGARNNSKGCGGVMRVAPAGLLLTGMIAEEDRLAREAFTLGAELAALTHGHPSGCLPAGVLAAPDFETAISVAVNHSGDSDSTGAITGNLLGAALGMAPLPARWLEPLELAAVTRDMGGALANVRCQAGTGGIES
jgi:ADP-ribosylglycohydrolase